MKIKNRLIAGVLSLVMVLSCVSGLTACKDKHDHDHDSCKHQWGEWSTTKAATCTEAGAKERKCSECEEIEKSAINALGHDWNEATCSAPKICKTCSATEGSASAHAYTVEAVKDEALKSPASTESAAVYYKSCACGAISTSDADTFTYGTPIGHTHSFTVETVKTEAEKSSATCEKAAVYYKSCSCGAVSTNDAETFTSGSALGHKDDNTDHVCDNNCGKRDMGTHADANRNHICDYGCTTAIGRCVDADKDHDCDYGCSKTFGSCVDADKDHDCDYGCNKTFGEHSDGNDNNHSCDYGCGLIADSGCYDTIVDGKCDECGADINHTCKDEDKNHACEICSKMMGKHEDANKDHACDYGCNNAIGNCVDVDKDHDCDYGCNMVFDRCTDEDKDHHCDYGCNKVFGACEDANKDHSCDYGCIKKIGECVDSSADDDHVCDYGCGKVLEDCSDKDSDADHACDICGNADVSSHNYGSATCGKPATCSECGATTGTTLAHKDENVDHICDNGCGKNDVGECGDSSTDDDHVCDYGCGKVLENCSDKNTDADHACDACGKANVTAHAYVENPALATGATCDAAATKVYTCNCGDTYTETDGDALAHNIAGVKAEERHVDGCKYVLVYVCQRADCGKDVFGETVYHHDYVASISKAATCKEPGEKTFKCSKCGDTSKTAETIPADATGHNWVSGEVVNGTRIDTCSICTSTKTVMVSDSNSASSNASDLANTDVQLKVDDNTNANIQLGQGVADAIGEKDITISAGVVGENTLKDMGISNEQLGQIGNNTVYDFNIKDENGTPISNFGKDNYVTITLPYTLGAGEDVDSIAVWFISDTCQVDDCDKGVNCVDAHKLVSIEATYNNGFVTFKTNHFSIYTVTRLTPEERCALYKHSYVEQVVEGSCTKDGYVLLVCVRCHDKQIKEGTLVEANGHDYSVEIHNATCTENGEILYNCKNCDHSYKTRLNATGHSWGIEASLDASCTTDGYVKYGCKNCAEEYTITSAKLAHKYTNTVVSATCTADGYTIHDCDNCDYRYIDTYVGAPGHAYKSAVWTWAADYSSATLTFVCENDDDHVMVLRATIKKNVVNGTCSSFVKTTYTATVAYNNADYTDQKVVETGTPDHNFSTDWSKDSNEHWHACVCGEKTDVAEHIFENATITKAPTCSAAGESVAYCVCGEAKTSVIPATGEHTYTDGVCTGCGKEYVNDYYINLINSWKNIDGFAIKMKDLSYEVKEKDVNLIESFKLLGSIKQIDIAELALYVEDGELGGAAIGSVVIFNGPISNANAVYKFKAVIHEGFVYISAEYGKDVANKTMNIKMSVDSAVEALLESRGIGGETAYVLEFFKDTVLPAIETLVEINSEDVNAILEDMFNMIFTFEQQADGSYIATLDYDKLHALNENLATKPVAEVIDIYFGEGAFDSIVEFVFEILDLESSEIPAYLDEKGLNSADLIAKINELARKTGAPDDYDIMDMLNRDELAGITLGMLVFDVEDDSYLDIVNEAVAELRATTLYDLMGADAAGEIKESVDAVLDMIADSVSLSFTTDADGMLATVAVDVDNFTSSESEIEVALNFSLEIIINGRIEVTWSDIIEEIENSIAMPSDDLLNDDIVAEYQGGGWGGYVEYQGIKYEYENGIRICAYKPLLDQLMYIISQPDCSGWIGYELCYGRQTYVFIFAEITVDGESVMLLIDEYSGEAVKLVQTETGFTAVFEDGTEKAIAFDFSATPNDLAKAYADIYLAVFDNPEGHVNAFGEYIDYYYNPELQQYSTNSHHDLEYEYEVRGDCCEKDGCSVRITCNNCDYYAANTRYWCDIDGEVEIDLSQYSSCGGSANVARCLICGKIRGVYGMNINCDMGNEIQEEILDADGKVIGYKYTSTCSRCGLVFIQQKWTEYHSTCEYTVHEGVSIYKGDVCILEYVQNWYNDDHNYEYSVGDDFVDCEQEHKVISRCTKCGDTSEWWTSEHRYEYREVELRDLGLCGGIIWEEYCPICDEILHSNVEDVCAWEYVEQTADGHDKYQCIDCGAVKIEYIHKGEKDANCRLEYIENRRYIVNDEEVYSHEITYFMMAHNYQFEYSLNGGSCEDGYTVTRYCPDCKRSENYKDSGHRHESKETDLGEYGLCGGYIYEEYCPVCDTVLRAHFKEACKWKYVETTSDGYEKYECRSCGAIKLEYYHSSEKDQDCKCEYTETRIYMIDGKEVYRYEQTSIQTEHAYQYSYKLHGTSCEDGYTRITTCKDCGVYWTDELDYHEVNEQERIDLAEFGACYGYFVYYSCACGQESRYENSCCADNWTSNEYYDKNDRLIHVGTGTCSACGLRYDQSYYTVEDAATCTSTSYNTITISIGNSLIYEKKYTEVGEGHSGKETVELIKGEGSSCLDGIRITSKCERCGHEDSRQINWHQMFVKERINLSELGSVCGGYATLSGCACGERIEMSLDHDLCENGTEDCFLWIEDAITEGQHTIAGDKGFWNNSYVYICSVTNPADKACGYKIRYAYYWMKDENSCMAYRYETWQFGYDEETGTCRYEVTFKTGDSGRIYHNYKDNGTENHVRFDCLDCGSYYERKWTYENGLRVKYEERVSNTLNNEYDKYREYIEEYAVDEDNKESYLTRAYWKYIHNDGTESWSEESISKYDGTFGENGRKVIRNTCERNGGVYGEEFAYVIYKGYEYRIYSLRTEGDAWYRCDYTYDFVDGCVQTIVYTDSNGENRSEYEDCCIFHEHVTTKKPTCSQSGERCDVCVICDIQTKPYVIDPTDHGWTETENGWYYCFRCGLENANGVSGTIIMEDLTGKYGNDENYVVGYCVRKGVNFTYYVCLVLADGTEIIVEDVEYTTIDGLSAYAFNKDMVSAYAESNGYTDYDVKFVFVPVGADGSFDYAIIFTETTDIGTITDDVSFVDYVGEGEWVSYEIAPVENGTWTFTSASYSDTYAELYDAQGNQVAFDDDSGEEVNFLIKYDLTAGEVYTIKVKWLQMDRAGVMSLIFTQTSVK